MFHNTISRFSHRVLMPVAVKRSPVRYSYFKTERRRCIKRITEISGSTLAPNLHLHLITPNCPLWRSSPEECPFPDPYWAFFWPGGQVLCRYLIDHCDMIKDKRVLDIGSGGGASAIVALRGGAEVVVANDIDEVALSALQMNMELNFNSDKLGIYSRKLFLSNQDILPELGESSMNTIIQPLKEMIHKTSNDSHIPTKEKAPVLFDTVLVGDLFYDDCIISRLYLLLCALKRVHPGIQILIGDPGRSFLQNHPMLDNMKVVTGYDLPEDNMDHGFSTGSVYEFKL